MLNGYQSHRTLTALKQLSPPPILAILTILTILTTLTHPPPSPQCPFCLLFFHDSTKPCLACRLDPFKMESDQIQKWNIAASSSLLTRAQSLLAASLHSSSPVLLTQPFRQTSLWHHGSIYGPTAPIPVSDFCIVELDSTMFSQSSQCTFQLLCLLFVFSHQRAAPPP